MNILIYKTNIRSEQDVKAIERALVKHECISRWSVDCDDIDHVLRIETTTENTSDIPLIITNAGYLCEDLPD
jgi:hypothetical protein